MEGSGFFRKKSETCQRLVNFQIVFRFIDALFIFNNDEFGNNYNDIYSDELELKKENEDL